MKGYILTVLLVAVVSFTSGQYWDDGDDQYRDVRQVVKGYWPQGGEGGRCHWTGCVSNRLPAFCGAGQIEGQRNGCANPTEIDVECCLGGNGGQPAPGPEPEPFPPAEPTYPTYPEPEPLPLPLPTPQPVPSPGPGFERCFRTGCAPVGLKEYCGAGIVEVARETCISGRLDVTCCKLAGSGPSSPGTDSGIIALPNPPRRNPNPWGGNNGGRDDPTKGYWDASGRCNWTGCTPRDSPAFCGAGQRESGRKPCNDPGRIDVQCC